MAIIAELESLTMLLARKNGAAPWKSLPSILLVRKVNRRRDRGQVRLALDWRQSLRHGMESLISGIIAADDGIDFTLGLQLSINILHEVLTTEQINLIDASGI